MCGAIPTLPQHSFKAWFFVKAQGQLYLKLKVQALHCHGAQTVQTFLVPSPRTKNYSIADK